jgi:hypothetical protein
LKEGASLDGFTVEAVDVVAAAMRVWAIYGLYNLTITSGTDGKHTASNSGHTKDFAGDEYFGFAMDLRTYDMPGGYRGQLAYTVVAARKAVLGPGYDVILEDTHIHVELDRRAFPNRQP